MDFRRGNALIFLHPLNIFCILPTQTILQFVAYVLLYSLRISQDPTKLKTPEKYCKVSTFGGFLCDIMSIVVLDFFRLFTSSVIKPVTNLGEGK